MAPARKKTRLSSDNDDMQPALANDNQSAPNTTSPHDGARHASLSMDPNAAGVVSGNSSNSTSTPRKRSPHQAAPGPRHSWYSAASWKAKALPTAAVVARECVSVDKGVSSESSSKEDGTRKPSQSVSNSFKGSSRKSGPLVAEATRVHAVPDPASVPKPRKSLGADEKGKVCEKQQAKSVPVESKGIVEEEAPLPPEPAATPAPLEDDAKAETTSMRPASGGWFGWWSRPDGDNSEAEGLKSSNKTAIDDAIAEQANDTPLPGTPELDAQDDASTQQGSAAEDLIGGPQPEMSTSTKYGSARSWFGLWSKAQKEQAEEEERQREADRVHREQSEQETGEPRVEQASLPPVQVTGEAEATTTNVKSTESVEPKDDEDRPRSSGWAFWSKDKPKERSKVSEEDTQKLVGELAVADTPSQSHPEAAQFNEQRDANAEVKRSGSLLQRGRKQNVKSKDLSGETTAAATPTGSQVQTPAFFTPNDTPESSPAPVQRGKLKQIHPNLVLPTFRDTYPTVSEMGYLDRLTRYIGSSLHLTQPAKSVQHPHVSPQPHKVHKAIAIGVHG